MDYLGLVKAVDGLGERVVAAVSNTPDRWFDASFSQSFGIFDRDILDAPVAVMDKAAAMARGAIVESLLQGVEHGASMRVRLTRQPTIRRANVSMTNAT